ncbi:MAG: hypothetical protein GY801_36865 [bacterium]|nr:hypothetical protein [bacterium]
MFKEHSPIAKVRINAFVVTLAGLSILRGLVYLVTNGRRQTQLGDFFNSIGQGQLFGIQLPIYESTPESPKFGNLSILRGLLSPSK